MSADICYLICEREAERDAPRAALRGALTQGAFTYFTLRRDIDSNIVGIEGYITDTYAEGDQVQPYRTLLDQLQGRALDPDTTRRFISKIIYDRRRLPGGTVLVRDSKDTSKPAHVFDKHEWAAFVAGAKAGEFDFGLDVPVLAPLAPSTGL